MKNKKNEQAIQCPGDIKTRPMTEEEKIRYANTKPYRKPTLSLYDEKRRKANGVHNG